MAVYATFYTIQLQQNSNKIWLKDFEGPMLFQGLTMPWEWNVKKSKSRPWKPNAIPRPSYITGDLRPKTNHSNFQDYKTKSRL